MKLAVLFAAALALLGCSSLDSDDRAAKPAGLQSDASTQDVSSKAVRIPFELVGDQVRVEATLNGHGPVHLCLDTGAPISGVLLFENERVSALGLELKATGIKVAGPSGRNASGGLLADEVSLALGARPIGPTRVLVMSPPDGCPRGLDGVIGGTVFFRYVVRIDMDEKVLVISEPEGWSPPPDVCTVPLVREGGSVFVDLRIAVGAEDPRPARVVVDTGSGDALTLNERAEGGFGAPSNAIEMPLSRDLSGIVEGMVGRVRRVEFGSFTFSDVVTSFPGEAHQPLAKFRDGNLGEGLLQHFNVTFDYAGGRMLLEKSKLFDEVFDIPMAGLCYDWEPDATLKIWKVLPHSPAAEAEIHEGDLLLAIDGARTGELGGDGVRKALQHQGAVIRLSIGRGSETLEKTIKLRRLV